eukprot:m.220918 g.220918  ORF g.220918 m.220918 type:complete len:184 (-) comp15120_c0_seq3:2026-2577(-)
MPRQAKRRVAASSQSQEDMEDQDQFDQMMSQLTSKRTKPTNAKKKKCEKVFLEQETKVCSAIQATLGELSRRAQDQGVDVDGTEDIVATLNREETRLQETVTDLQQDLKESGDLVGQLMTALADQASHHYDTIKTLTRGFQATLEQEMQQHEAAVEHLRQQLDQRNRFLAKLHGALLLPMTTT